MNDDTDTTGRDLTEISIYGKAHIIATQNELKAISTMLNKYEMLDNPEYLEAVWTCMVFVAETKLLARQTANQAETLHNILAEYVNKYRTDTPPEATP